MVKFSKLIAGALAMFLITQNPVVIALNDPGKTYVKKATSLTVDPSKSTMTWNAKKVGGVKRFKETVKGDTPSP